MSHVNSGIGRIDCLIKMGLTKMKILLAILFCVHGIAHLVGFVVPWQITKMEDMPYKTTLLSGQINVGDTGIRIVGLLWLMAAVGFVISGIAVLRLTPWWNTWALYISLFSLILSILGWPESKIGVLVNLLILIFLVWGDSIRWIPPIGQ